jgi:prevent-host-death family protein
MKDDTYSVYEAKAKFSQVLRSVRSGKVVTVTYRGEPVAEIRPLSESETGLEQRLVRLSERGVLKRPNRAKVDLRPAKQSSGALSRFLEERD